MTASFEGVFVLSNTYLMVINTRLGQHSHSDMCFAMCDDCVWKRVKKRWRTSLESVSWYAYDVVDRDVV